MRFILPAITVLVFIECAFPLFAAEPKSAWEGVIHLGDSPEAYVSVVSSGLAMQIPLKAEAGRKTKLTITTADIQTLTGDGHYVEVYAHFQNQPAAAPAKEVWVETFRLKDKTTGDDKEYVFEFDSGKNLSGARPEFYSVKVKVDTSIVFSLWDDFLVKRIALE